MRLFVCGLLLLISPTSAITAQNQSPMGGLTLAIKEVKPAGVVTVELNNSSQNGVKRIAGVPRIGGFCSSGMVGLKPSLRIPTECSCGMDRVSMK